MQYKAWFERTPGRLNDEIAAFAAAGWDFRLDEPTLTEYGVVVIEGSVQVLGQQYRLQVLYPSGFPYVRPEVICKSVRLQRHQNPVDQNLCVIPNGDSAWRFSDRGASLVGQAVALIAASRAGPSHIANAEVDAPEPASTWYFYSPGASLIILDEIPVAKPGSHGKFRVLIPNRPPGPLFQAYLAQVEFPDRPEWRISNELKSELTGPELEGVWIHCGAPPSPIDATGQPADAAHFLNEAIARNQKVQYYLDKQSKNGTALAALVYQDEGPTRGQFHDNWLVAMRVANRPTLLLRPLHFSKVDQFQRIPSLAPIAEKKALIVGLGALGAGVGISLARAGIGHVGVVDFDFVETGPLVRQEYDLWDVGLQKTFAIARQMKRINPRITTEEINWKVGSTNPRFREDGEKQDSLGVFADRVKGYDIIICTSGLNSIDFVVNELGAALGIPRVFGWVTSGAWGGRVFRAQLGRACFECFSHCWDQFPAPEDDPIAIPIYARGCGFQAFTGTGIDAQAVGNLVSRLSVQTLLAGEIDGYPDIPGNLLVWNNRSSADAPLPSIKHCNVEVQPECQICQRYAC